MEAKDVKGKDQDSIVKELKERLKTDGQCLW
jgi:hypothetical protein